MSAQRAPSGSDKWGTCPEPYYQDDSVTIYNADCREVIRFLVADALLTDPPYGIQGGKGGDNRINGKGHYDIGGGWEDTPEYIRGVVVPVLSTLIDLTERAAITPGIRHLYEYPRPMDIGCFWQPAASTHGPWGFSTFNPILYYGKDPRGGLGAWPSGRVVTKAAEKSEHPCPKPLNAWTWLLEKVSKEGETVLDPFMGVGTTLRAAKNSGRKAIGIEIEERYCELAVQRLAQGSLFEGVA